MAIDPRTAPNPSDDLWYDMKSAGRRLARQARTRSRDLEREYNPKGEIRHLLWDAFHWGLKDFEAEHGPAETPSSRALSLWSHMVADKLVSETSYLRRDRQFSEFGERIAEGMKRAYRKGWGVGAAPEFLIDDSDLRIIADTSTTVPERYEADFFKVIRLYCDADKKECGLMLIGAVSELVPDPKFYVYEMAYGAKENPRWIDQHEPFAYDFVDALVSRGILDLQKMPPIRTERGSRYLSMLTGHGILQAHKMLSETCRLNPLSEYRSLLGDVEALFGRARSDANPGRGLS